MCKICRNSSKVGFGKNGVCIGVYRVFQGCAFHGGDGHIYTYIYIAIMYMFVYLQRQPPKSLAARPQSPGPGAAAPRCGPRGSGEEAPREPAAPGCRGPAAGSVVGTPRDFKDSMRFDSVQGPYECTYTRLQMSAYTYIES